MQSLSLRARLTLAFAIAMAIVVTGLGLFVYGRAGGSLAQAIDQGLRARAVDVASLANQADNGLSSAGNPLTGPDQNFGQLIETGGRVYDETRGLARSSLLTHAQLARVKRGGYFLDLRNPHGSPARAFVEPIHAQDRSLVLLVGTSLSAEHSALAGLRMGLLIGGPIALLLSALGGYLLAGAALRPLQQARDRERQFLADASHELRTPLALLKTEIEVALDARPSIEGLLSSLRSAREETDRLVQLAEDLLLLAQVDRGTLPVRIALIEASELAKRIATRFAPRAASENRRIQTSAPAGVMLQVDPLRIEQALANLIDNSLRHGAGLITLEVAPRGSEVELHVRDQGDGIPPEFKGRAFERFARADKARHAHGTGLGLAIVAAIAEAHGGEAAVGEGSDVFLRLPAHARVSESACLDSRPWVVAVHD